MALYKPKFVSPGFLSNVSEVDLDQGLEISFMIDGDEKVDNVEVFIENEKVFKSSEDYFSSINYILDQNGAYWETQHIADYCSKINSLLTNSFVADFSKSVNYKFYLPNLPKRFVEEKIQFKLEGVYYKHHYVEYAPFVGDTYCGAEIFSDSFFSEDSNVPFINDYLINYPKPIAEGQFYNGWNHATNLESEKDIILNNQRYVSLKDGGGSYLTATIQIENKVPYLTFNNKDFYNRLDDIGKKHFDKNYTPKGKLEGRSIFENIILKISTVRENILFDNEIETPIVYYIQLSAKDLFNEGTVYSDFSLNSLFEEKDINYDFSTNNEVIQYVDNKNFKNLFDSELTLDTMLPFKIYGVAKSNSYSLNLLLENGNNVYNWIFDTNNNYLYKITDYFNLSSGNTLTGIKIILEKGDSPILTLNNWISNYPINEKGENNLFKFYIPPEDISAYIKNSKKKLDYTIKINNGIVSTTESFVNISKPIVDLKINESFSEFYDTNKLDVSCEILQSKFRKIDLGIGLEITGLILQNDSLNLISLWYNGIYKRKSDGKLFYAFSGATETSQYYISPFLENYSILFVCNQQKDICPIVTGSYNKDSLELVKSEGISFKIYDTYFNSNIPEEKIFYINTDSLTDPRGATDTVYGTLEDYFVHSGSIEEGFVIKYKWLKNSNNSFYYKKAISQYSLSYKTFFIVDLNLSSSNIHLCIDSRFRSDLSTIEPNPSNDYLLSLNYKESLFKIKKIFYKLKSENKTINKSKILYTSNPNFTIDNLIGNNSYELFVELENERGTKISEITNFYIREKNWQTLSKIKINSNADSSVHLDWSNLLNANLDLIISDENIQIINQGDMFPNNLYLKNSSLSATISPQEKELKTLSFIIKNPPVNENLDKIIPLFNIETYNKENNIFNYYLYNSNEEISIYQDENKILSLTNITKEDLKISFLQIILQINQSDSNKNLIKVKLYKDQNAIVPSYSNYSFSTDTSVDFDFNYKELENLELETVLNINYEILNIKNISLTGKDSLIGYIYGLSDGVIVEDDFALNPNYTNFKDIDGNQVSPIFATNFSNTDFPLSAGDGGLNRDFLNKITIFRKDSHHKNVWQNVGNISNGNTYFIDYGAPNNCELEYMLYFGENILYAPIFEKTQIYNHQWTLLVCNDVFDENGLNPNKVEIDKIFYFDLNIQSGSMTNNTDIQISKNFTKYPKYQVSSSNYWSGQLTGLVGFISANGGTYYQNIEMLEELAALTNDGKRKFLKDIEGNVWEVAISAPISIQNMDNLDIQLKTKTLSWTQVGDAKNMMIYSDIDLLDKGGINNDYTGLFKTGQTQF